MRQLFTMQGRLNRAEFLIDTLLILGTMLALSGVGFLILATTGGEQSPYVEVIAFALIAAFIGTIVLSAFACVKRLHDLGRPGSHYWLMFIPLNSLEFALLFKRGTEGPNRFGEDPLKDDTSEVAET